MNNLLRIKEFYQRTGWSAPARWLKVAAVLAIAAGTVASLTIPPSTRTVGNIHLAHNPIYQAFQASGAEVYASNLSGWAQINNKYLSVSELDDLGQQVVHALGLDPATVKCQPTEEKGFRGLQYGGLIGRQTRANVIIQTWDPPAEDINPYPETYLIVNLEETGSLELLSSGPKRMNDVFALFGAVPNINTGITGTIDGLIPEEEKSNLARVIFTAVGAEVLESLVEPGIVSFTGYTPAIKESLLAGDKKINLNVALRYHSIDGKTYVHIASPIIMSEY